MEGRAKVTKEVLCEEARFILANVMAEARYGRQNRFDDIRRHCSEIGQRDDLGLFGQVVQRELDLLQRRDVVGHSRGLLIFDAAPRSRGRSLLFALQHFCQ